MHEMDTYPIVYNYHFIDADLQLVAESLFDAYHINHVHRNSIKGMMGALKDERMEFNVQVDENSLTGKYFRDNDRSILNAFILAIIKSRNAFRFLVSKYFQAGYSF